MTDTTAPAANAAMDDHWNGRAGETWVELGRLLDQQLHALGLEAQGALDLKPGEWVVDIGCGGGATSIDLARAVSPGGAVLGVDISRTLLQQVAEPRVAALAWTSGSRLRTPRPPISGASGSTRCSRGSA